MCLTCSQEHNLILSIISQNSVHNNVSQGVVHFDTREHGATTQGVHRAIHQRVESNKSDNFIREVFGGLDPWIICLAWALKWVRSGMTSQLISDYASYMSSQQLGCYSLRQFIGMCLLLEAKLRTTGCKTYVEHLSLLVPLNQLYSLLFTLNFSYRYLA